MIKNRLNEDQRKADEEFLIVETLLSDATKRLYEAISKKGILGLKLAKEMLDTSKKK